MSKPFKLSVIKWVALLVITGVTIGVPTWVLDELNFTGAASVAGVVTLGALIASVKAGVRAGLVFTFAASALMSAVVLAAPYPIAAIALMTLAGIALGLSSLRGWASAMVLAPIMAGFIIAQPSEIKFSLIDDAFGVAFACLFFSLIAVGLVALLRGKKDANSKLIPVSRPRAIGYAIMLGSATLVTTSIAVFAGWGHAGGWLIMTPFLVLQPYQRDALVKGLARLGGTVVGFIFVFAVLAITDAREVLAGIGLICAMVSMWALANGWRYAFYAMFLTPAVVLLEGLRTSVESTGWDRLWATGIGVLVSLVIIVVLSPLYSRRQKESTDEVAPQT